MWPVTLFDWWFTSRKMRIFPNFLSLFVSSIFGFFRSRRTRCFVQMVIFWRTSWDMIVMSHGCTLFNVFRLFWGISTVIMYLQNFYALILVLNLQWISSLSSSSPLSCRGRSLHWLRGKSISEGESQLLRGESRLKGGGGGWCDLITVLPVIMVALVVIIIIIIIRPCVKRFPLRPENNLQLQILWYSNWYILFLRTAMFTRPSHTEPTL